MATGGISGLAVGLSTLGGVLLWSGIRNRHPTDLVREALGQPAGTDPISPPFSSVGSGVAIVRRVAATPAGTGTGTLGVAGKAGELVAEARKHLGARYVWATAGPNTFDCSGLVIYCLKKIGVGGVPRFTTYTFGAWAKAQGAVKVAPASFQTGDIILRTGHMGIAISGTRMIHAPNAGSTVREGDIYSRSTWWGWRLWGNPTAYTAEKSMGNR